MSFAELSQRVSDVQPSLWEAMTDQQEGSYFLVLLLAAALASFALPTTDDFSGSRKNRRNMCRNVFIVFAVAYPTLLISGTWIDLSGGYHDDEPKQQLETEIAAYLEEDYEIDKATVIWDVEGFDEDEDVSEVSSEEYLELMEGVSRHSAEVMVQVSSGEQYSYALVENDDEIFLAPHDDDSDAPAPEELKR